MSRVFGVMPDGTEVQCISIGSGEIECEVITYGAALRSLKVPDRNGSFVDVVLGYDSLEDYRTRSGRMGAVMGRCTNRISGGHINVGGKDYQLTLNRGKDHIHGGERGFDKRVWDVESLSDSSVTMHLNSPDGEEGYPGELDVRVTYSVNGMSLRIDYLAHANGDTVCNLTNHSYFNLVGKGDVSGHRVSVLSDSYTPSDPDGIPTGEIRSVGGTCFDLRKEPLMGDVLGDSGFDQNYILSDRHAASAFCDVSGISMDVFTDLPAMQFYTAGGLKDGTPGKGGMTYGRFGGLCFEAQFPPDAPNHSEFPSVMLRADEDYRHFVEYVFLRK